MLALRVAKTFVYARDISNKTTSYDQRHDDTNLESQAYITGDDDLTTTKDSQSDRSILPPETYKYLWPHEKHQSLKISLANNCFIKVY